MARAGINAEEARQQLLEAAQRYVALRRGAVVLVAAGPGPVDIVRQSTPPATAAEGYDAAVLAALSELPQSARRVAARAGHRFNSYFRGRLSRLVDVGLARHLSRGYALP